MADEKPDEINFPDILGKIATKAAKVLGDLFLQAQPGKVISATELLSEKLRRALLRKMRQPLSRNKQDDLFDGYGPLSTFAARIDVSYALNLIDEDLRVDLKRINGIRNDFAHTESLTFESPEIVKQLHNFRGFTSAELAPALHNENFFTQIIEDITKRLNLSLGEMPPPSDDKSE